MDAGPGDATVELALDGLRVRWPLPECAPADLVAVDALARLVLAVRRAGGELTVVGPTPPLRALLDLCGLSVEVLGEAEGGEQAVVEEAVVADDPIA
jgi:hypothetical protein